MLDLGAQRLDLVFHALAHSVRREILDRIAEREHTITELAKPYDMTLEGVSQHVRVLERAGLLERRRQGRTHRCSLNPHPLGDAAATLARLARFWEARLDSLGDYLTAGD